MPFFGDHEQEYAAVDQANTQRNQNRQAALQIDDTQAQAISDVGAVHPYLDTGTATALGAAKLDPYGPVAQFTAYNLLRMRAEDPGGYSKVGDRMRSELMNLSADNPGFALNLSHLDTSNLDPDMVAKLASAVRVKTDPEGFLGGSDPISRVAGRLGEAVSSKVAPAAEKVGGWLPEWSRNAVKGAARSFDASASYIPQLIGGSFGEFYNGDQQGSLGGLMVGPSPSGAVHIQKETSVGQIGIKAASDISQGNVPDLQTGSGFFIGDHTEEQRQAAEKLYRGTNTLGQTNTAGRWIMGHITEPGSVPYQVGSGLIDLPVAWEANKVDPLTLLRDATKAENTFTAIDRESKAGQFGLLNGATRRTYSSENVDSFLAGGEGQKIVDRAAEITDIKKLDKATGGKLAPSTLVQMADTTDPDEMRTLLRSKFGLEMTEPPKLGPVANFGDLVDEHQPRTLVRLESTKPGSAMDMQDGRSALSQTENVLRNSHADEATVSTFMDQMARADTPASRFKVYADVLGDIADRVTEKLGGTDEARAQAKSMTTAFVDSHKASVAYNADWIANNTPNLDGLIGPHLLSEHLNRYAPMPDNVEIARTMSAIAPFYNIPGVKPAISMLDGAQNVWKQGIIAKLGLPIKVIADHQARMAAGDLQSVFNHPVGFISWALGSGDGRVSRLMDKLGVEGRGEISPVGDLFAQSDEMAAVMSRNGSAVLGDTDSIGKKLLKLRTQHYYPYQNDTDGFLGAVHHEYGMMSGDTIAPKVARALLSDGVNGDGDVFTAAREAVRNDVFGLKQLDKLHPEWKLHLVGQQDRYADSIVDRLIKNTGNNPELLDAIANGRLKDDAGNMIPIYRPGSTKLNPAFEEKLGEFRDNLPPKQSGPTTVTMRKTEKEQAKDARDRVVDTMWGHLLNTPNDRLAQSPTFRQLSWKRAAQFAPALDPQYADELVANAKAANLSKADIRQLDYWARKEPPDALTKVVKEATDDAPAVTQRGLDLKQLDSLSKGHALDDTKQLLYDATEKGNFQDAARIVYPFIRPWAQFLQSWGQLVLDKPRLINRFNQIYTEAKSPDFGGVTGAPDKQGWFHGDNNGNEVFSYPMSKLLVQAVYTINNELQAKGVPTGIPSVADPSSAAMPLTGKVAGLSMGANLFPGAGLVASVPLAHILPDTPQWDGVRTLMFPAGAPKKSDDWRSMVIDQSTPSWMRDIFTRDGGLTGDSKSAFMHMQRQMQDNYLSTGNYPINDPKLSTEERMAAMNRLIDDSRNATTAAMLVRAGAKFVSPSSPSYDWEIKDKTGQRLALSTLIDDYRAMTTNPATAKTATTDFIAKYGQNAMLVMRGDTMGVSAALPAPSEGLNDWVRSNPDVKKKFPLTYGFFAPNLGPTDDKGKYSADAYMRQIRDGERVDVTPAAAPRMGNDMVARALYYEVHDAALKASPGRSTLTAKNAAVLKQYDDMLVEQYPGYKDKEFDPTQTIKPDEYIRQLKLAVKAPELASDPLTKSITDYLDVRDAVMARSKETLKSETGFATSKGGTAFRGALSKYADALTAEDPRFGRVWERVFLPEIQTGLLADENRGLVPN